MTPKYAPSMYCTPCARLMKSITPNTSVSPAAIRNSSTPSCRPLRVWTTTSASGTVRGPRGARSAHLAVLDVRVGHVAEHLLDDLGLVAAVGALRDLGQVEVLDGIMVGVEAELAAQRLEVGLHQRRAQRVLVAGVALGLAQRAVDQQRGVVSLERIGSGHRVVGVLVGGDEAAVAGVVQVGRPVRAAEQAERGILFRRQRPVVTSSCLNSPRFPSEPCEKLQTSGAMGV